MQSFGCGNVQNVRRDTAVDIGPVGFPREPKELISLKVNLISISSG